MGLLLVNVATILLVYLLAVRLSSKLAGLVAAASYALLSTSFSVLGLAAHATHFVVISALAGLLLMLRGTEVKSPWQLFASGFLAGLAFLMKQPGIAFTVFCGLYLLYREFPNLIEWKDLVLRIGPFLVGMALPFCATSLILLGAGVFTNFWFWVFRYAGEYVSETGFSFGVQNFMAAFPAVVGPSAGVWLIAALGLTTPLWHRENRRHAGLICGFLLCSFLAVCPGLAFREHYFILMLPVTALLAGIAVSSAAQILARAGHGWTLSAIPVLLFSTAFGYAVVKQRTTLFETSPLRAVQDYYGYNPFPEAVVVAQYLNAHTSGNDRIAVLGSEPEIYFYAKRHSATGFIYMYGLMEQQKYSFEMQKRMIREIESAHPKFLVTVISDLSWSPTPGSPQVLAFTAWSTNYLASQYELVGIADRVDDHTEYRWDGEANSYQPSSQALVEVFKRKG